jgi:phosphoglycolate phosphatase
MAIVEARVKAIVFDFDGTLVNSATDIEVSLNYALKEFGLPEHGAEAVRGMVGDGATSLIERALPRNLPEDTRQQVLSVFRVHYHESDHASSLPYPGVMDLLFALMDRGIGLGIVSNKPDNVLQRVCPKALPGIPFGFIAGERADIPRKPDPTGVLLALQALGAQRHEAMYVGDTAVDIHVAKAAKMKGVGVAWGFRPAEELVRAGAEHMVATPAELLAML